MTVPSSATATTPFADRVQERLALVGQGRDRGRLQAARTTADQPREQERPGHAEAQAEPGEGEEVGQHAAGPLAPGRVLLGHHRDADELAARRR